MNYFRHNSKYILIIIFLTLTDTDLHNVIKKGNILKDIHKRYIMYQVSNVNYLPECKVI